MSDQSLARQLVPLAKVIAMTSSGIATGAIWSFSYVGVPVILQAPPDLLARSWQTAYDIGAGTMPFFALAISSSFAFLASQSTKQPGRFPNQAFDPTSPLALYTGAALAIPAIIPYTLGIMKPTNDRLLRKAKEPNSISEGETRQLIRNWSGMNYNRAVIALVGTLIGGVAVLSS